MNCIFRCRMGGTSIYKTLEQNPGLTNNIGEISIGTLVACQYSTNKYLPCVAEKYKDIRTTGEIKKFSSGLIKNSIACFETILETEYPIYIAKDRIELYNDKQCKGSKYVIYETFIVAKQEDKTTKTISCTTYKSDGTNFKTQSGWVKSEELNKYSKYPGKIDIVPVVVTTTTKSAPAPSKPKVRQVNEDSGKNTDGSVSSPPSPVPSVVTVEEDVGSGYRPENITFYKSTAAQEQKISSTSTFNDISSIRGVFGLPYQFLPSADGRLNDQKATKGKDINGVGREYADKIVGKIPLLFIAPGRSNFMTRYSKQEKKNILSKLIEDGVGLLDTSKEKLEDLLDKNGRYFTFEYNTVEYYKYVNPMCRIAARYLEIQNFDLGQLGTLDNADWSAYTNGSIFETGTDFAHIPFYLDSDTSISEDFGNTLADSSLSSFAGNISDMGRELRFITGYSSEMLDSNWLKENGDVTTHLANMEEAVNGILGGKNFLRNIANSFSTVASGGRLVFPKIWGDSDFGRQYSVKIKLVSPDCNKLSIYLNILVPLFHLLGLVAPQTISGNPNGYGNPFLVRAIYKNFFNVDMGIITSMGVEKGGDCMWTVDGLPTSIEVSLTIKDLYDYMAISDTNGIGKDKWAYDTLGNTAQMDYIANLCGINMYKPEVGRQISMWAVNTIANPIIDFPRNMWKKVNNTIATSVSNIFR